MNATGNYLPLSTGSLIFWEPDTSSFSPKENEKRGIRYATRYMGLSVGSSGREMVFESTGDSFPNTAGVQFSVSHFSNDDFILSLTSISKELHKLLDSGNMLLLYPSERETEVIDLISLLYIATNPSSIPKDITLSPSPWGKPLEEWRKEFLTHSFQIFKDRVRNHSTPIQVEEMSSSYSTADSLHVESETTPTSTIAPSPKPNTTNGLTTYPSAVIDSTAVSRSPVVGNSPIVSHPTPETNATSSQSTSSVEVKTTTDSTVSNKKEVATNEKSVPEVPSAPVEIETKFESGKDKKPETNGNETNDQDNQKVNAKFSIQLKMMGIISLILAATVSTIILLATYYFKDDAEKRVQVNNLAMVELVGLKVSSDIQSIVAKAEQLVTSSLRSNIASDDKEFINNLFFSNDKDFIFVGLFSRANDDLVEEKRFFSEDNLIDSNLTEEDINSAILRNKESLLKAFLGKPIIINSTPGFPLPSFILALPANAESEGSSKILVIQVKLEKILRAFDKKDITTTFMVSDDGRVVAHPEEELVVSATNFMDKPIVKALLTSQVDTGQLRYAEKDGSPYMGSYRKVNFGDAGIISIVSEEKAFQEVYRLQERNLYIMGISLCLALIIVFFFAKSLTKPILNLLSATLEIAKGNFQVGIKPTTKDEVGLLTNYFITMGEGLEEREKVKSILGSMIDPVVVQEAMVDLAALKRGKEAEITSFFCDVAGFSTISEQLTSVDLASLLNEYLSAMTLILKDNEGVLDKYIGDAIVGIFGAPVTVDNHAIKACKASLEMIIKLEELRQYWQKNNLYSKEAQIMDARIGLNTGPAKVGFMGTDALASYTMMGDTVNLAARLEAAGKDYGVNIMIAENTYNLVKDAMEIRILDLVRVKGKNEPVRVYELVGFKNDIPGNIVDAINFYEAGFQEYLNQNWDKAIQNFQKTIDSKSGKDKSSSMLIDRCKTYKSQSPGKDWDGVFTRTTK